MNSVYMLFLIGIFMAGVILGSIVTFLFVYNTEENTTSDYVDDDKKRKLKKYFFSRHKRRKYTDDHIKNNSTGENAGLLESRLSDEMSLTEQVCMADGLCVGDVLQGQQDEVDTDFEYLTEVVDAKIEKER